MHTQPGQNSHPDRPTAGSRRARNWGASRAPRVFAVAVAVGALVATAATSAFGSGARTITTIAGSPSGLYGFYGDGGPASDALLKKPSGLAVDPQGNIFVADSGNSRVRKINPEGTITTIAGSGVAGYLGDGGPATSARISPTSLAVDAVGNVYIGDCEHEVVRKVDPSGGITTYVGTGFQGFSGDGGPATAAKLHCPVGLAVDGAGDLFIADRDNNRVREVSTSGTINTVAGNGSPPVSSALGNGGPATSGAVTPEAIALDGKGDLFIADAYENEVRKVDSSGTITTIAGRGRFEPFNTGDGGPASSAALNYPAGIATDGNGDVFVATLCRVREIDPGGTITTIAGTEYCGLSGDGCAATAAQFWGANSGVPVPLASSSGNLLLVDYSANNVRKILTTEPPASCTAPTTPKPSPQSAPKPPVVKITSAPPAETAEQKASFTFKGVTGGTYECSIDDGAWARCTSGKTFGPLAPGDHLFEVRETLAGLTGPVASYRWTIDLPRACVLRVARARVFAYTKQHKVRLVIHYTSYRPANVTVSYKLPGTTLGSASANFSRAGVFRLPENLSAKQVGKVVAAKRFQVHFEIPKTPGSCGRYYTKQLTIPKKISGQTVWFQSDSIFAP
jgi:NHL repeat-containing protein